MLAFPTTRSTPTCDPDTADVRRARAGDREAFRAIVQRHMRRTYTIAQTILQNHDDTDHAVEEAWGRVWGALGEAGASSSFAAWVSRIVADTAHDIRRSRAERSNDRIPDDVAAAVEYDPDEDSTPPQAVASALARLSARRRHIFVFHDVHGMRDREIAETLGLPVKTVRAELMSARGDLRNLLGIWRADGNGLPHPVTTGVANRP